MKPLLLILLIFENFLGPKVINAQIKSLQCDPGKCVSLLDESKTKQYIKNFESTYYTNYNTKHSLKIEYPVEYFILFSEYLQSHPTFDGIRFVFASFNKLFNKEDMSDSNQIIVMAAPTLEKRAIWSEFESFNNGKWIINDYTKKVKLFNKPKQTKKPSKLDHSLFIFPPESLAKNYINNYKSIYKDKTKYSESLYLCKENFFLIDELLKSNLGKSVDAIALMFVHYNEFIPGTFQIGKQQFSLAIVPSIDGELKFNLIKDYLLTCQSLTDEKKEAILKLFNVNHGELCLSACN